MISPKVLYVSNFPNVTKVRPIVALHTVALVSGVGRTVDGPGIEMEDYTLVYWPRRGGKIFIETLRLTFSEPPTLPPTPEI